MTRLSLFILFLGAMAQMASRWSHDKLEAARKFSLQIESGAVVILHKGEVVDQWGIPSRPFNVASIRKSLLSSLIGIAVDEGKLSLDTTLQDLGIDDKTPALTDSEKKAKVRDLLTSRSGVYHPAAYETESNRNRRPARESHPPGTFFYYNNWDFNVLGTIYEKATGENLFEAFDRRIARPLGFQDYHVENMESRKEDVSDYPAYIFRVSARDLAKFGQMYLQNGVWQGKRLVPEAWIKESTAAHVMNAGTQGNYGYLWWRSENTVLAQGNGGQVVAIDPDSQTVIVHLTDMESPLMRRIRERPVSDIDGFRLLQMIFRAYEPVR